MIRVYELHEGYILDNMAVTLKCCIDFITIYGELLIIQ
jgi:hypothetical protein